MGATHHGQSASRNALWRTAIGRRVLDAVLFVARKHRRGGTQGLYYLFVLLVVCLLQWWSRGLLGSCYRCHTAVVQKSVLYCISHFWFNSLEYNLQLVKGWKNEQEERRAEKLVMLRRRGKGPPKKGSKVKTNKKKKK